MSKMTLEQVRYYLREDATSPMSERGFSTHELTEMADAIDERIKADEMAVQSARERVEMALREPNSAKAAQVASELGAAHRAANPPAQPTALEDAVREVIAQLNSFPASDKECRMANKLTAAIQENAK